MNADAIIESCERCGEQMRFVWHAPDAIWSAFAGEYRILCIACFDTMAEEKKAILIWVPQLHPATPMRRYE